MNVKAPPRRTVPGIHPSGPLALLGWQRLFLGYACGLLGAAYFWSACLALLLLGLASARGKEVFFLGGAFLLGLAVGGNGHNPPEEFWNATVRVSGVVEEVRTYPGGRVNIVAGQVRDADSGGFLPGRLLWTLEGVSAPPGTGSRFEARLRIRKLQGRANFGLSSPERFWARENVWHRAYSRGDEGVGWSEDVSVRSRLMARIETLLPQGGGAAVRALLFGDRLRLEPEFMDRIRRAGLAHSLALSGLHLGLAAAFGFGAAWVLGAMCPPVLLRIPRQKLGLVLALPVAAAYLWLGGFALSLQRAFLMLAVMAAHQLSGMRHSLQDSLLWAICLLVLPDPAAVHDVSLQLSVLAVAGIVLYLPLFNLSRLREKIPPPVMFPLTLAAVTVCANLFLLPVQALYFSEFPPFLLLNLVWLPVLSLVTLPFCFAGLVLSFFWDGGAGACFWLAGWTVDSLAFGLEVLDRGGWLDAVAVQRPSGVEVIGYWAALVAASALLAHRGPSRGRCLAFLGLGLMLLSAPAAWQMLNSATSRIEMTVLDTGMSQAVFVRTAAGRTLLFDGAGAWGSDYDPGRAVVGPALAWNHPPRVDMVFLSHMDADHARGLFHILDTFDVGFFGWTGLLDKTEDSRRLRGFLDRNQTFVRVLRRGDRISVEPGLWLEVLHPGREYRGVSSNDSSLVLRLVWRGKGLALLPGDAERRALREMLLGGAPLQSDVLILPHHGSRSGLSPRLYEAVNAGWAVAACGPDNRFGFPHPEVVAACEEQGMRVLTTARYGAVRFSWVDGDLERVRSVRYSLLPEDVP